VNVSDLSALLILLNAHTANLTEWAEEEIETRIRDRTEGDLDVSYLALRQCACGETIDGFYEYIDHLKTMAAA
jgi:hypothetical protein